MLIDKIISTILPKMAPFRKGANSRKMSGTSEEVTSVPFCGTNSLWAASYGICEIRYAEKSHPQGFTHEGGKKLKLP